MSERDVARDAAWAAHERAQLERWRALSYRERLAWLWQAKQFAAKAVASAQRRSPQTTPR